MTFPDYRSLMSYGNPAPPRGAMGLMGPQQLMLQDQSFLSGSGMVGGLTPDQFRLDTLNRQMQPDPVLNYLNAGIQGVGTLGNLGMGIWGLIQAQQAFDWQKGMADKNYFNSVKSYNTAVEDRVRGGYTAEFSRANPNVINDEVNKRKLGS